MIPVEEAIIEQKESAGFLMRNRQLMTNDVVMFPQGIREVDQHAIVFGTAPLYTWAANIQRIVDTAAEVYPITTAEIANHHFHAPTMLWLFDRPIATVMPPVIDQPMVADLGPQDIDALLICQWRRGSVPAASEIQRRLMRQFDPVAREEERQRVETSSDGVRIHGYSTLRPRRQVDLIVGKSGARPNLLIPIIGTTIKFGYGRSLTVDDVVNKNDPTILSEIATIERWVLAGAALLKQRILVPQQVNPSRGEQKRLDKAGLNGTVRTIVLRQSSREERSLPCINPVDWSCRWIVNGHWRHQWYPSDREHRIIWIPSFVKGPADKPLQVRSSVFAVTR